MSDDLPRRCREAAETSFSGRGVLYAAADRIEALEVENSRLREALTAVIAVCDQGRMVARGGGACGMTIESQIRGSVIHGVPAWPIEEARAALKGE